MRSAQLRLQYPSSFFLRCPCLLSAVMTQTTAPIVSVIGRRLVVWIVKHRFPLKVARRAADGQCRRFIKPRYRLASRVLAVVHRLGRNNERATDPRLAD